MDETTQKILALCIVAIVIGLELLRRYKKKHTGKAGCDGCDTSNSAKTNEKGETPVKFYKRH
ncbi:MAG: hypothetical protein GY727_01440 [Gammaproteobacteria bacterium]|nr:hypothetical protein [Gammaproteobacteria bacterium]MCP4088925.1 hypothetical protein [Gammaproteobacteria bacterium]MCP4274941.1 hypothetical protein [Gammaproteobacteria bacterium]MCP4831992.1 hypothetical protein [Gammaproteobacteria bacterium]MCP4929427.1 hypothetical protein [Gammaproteobacteria bacterium]